MSSGKLRKNGINLHSHQRLLAVDREVTRSSLEREVWGSNRSRSNQTQCCQRLATAANNSSKGAVLYGHNDAKRDPTNSVAQWRR